MKMDIDEMPLKKYSDLTIPSSLEKQVSEECYDHLLLPREDSEPSSHEIFSIFADEIFVNSVATGRIGFGPIIDPIFHGWFKTIRIIQLVLKFVGVLLHRRNHTNRVVSCFICSKSSPSERDAVDVLMRYESLVIKATLKPEKLSLFKEVNGVLYYQSRITAENPFTTHDLDQVPFLDMYEFTGKIPVIMLDSPVLYSYIMALHTKILPHSGIEATMKELSRKFKV